MALNAPMTFGEAVNEVFVRCSFPTSGNTHAQYLDLVRSTVRRAHAQLFPEAEWQGSQTEADIPLTAGLSQYDQPDDCPVGKIDAAYVKDTSGNIHELDFGVRPNERMTADMGLGTGCPILLDFRNRVLILYPAPADPWATLVLTYTRMPNMLNDEADPLTVDGELVVQLATMQFKRHLQLPVDPADLAEYERYLDKMKAMHSSGGGFQFGGHQSRKVRTQRRNRIAARKWAVGPNAPDYTDWNPF